MYLIIGEDEKGKFLCVDHMFKVLNHPDNKVGIQSICKDLKTAKPVLDNFRSEFRQIKYSLYKISKVRV